jgi:A/G-specific adenine glycosylase
MKNRSIPRFRRALLAWYGENRRRLPWRETRDPYRVWVSEVMLQQTRVETVVRYWPEFLERFPDVSALAEADLEAVLKAWEGLGYYARARNLRRAARVVVHEHGGSVPSVPEAFRALPGVGEYIAAAVMSIAFDRPMAVVDGNVKRLLARLLEVGDPVGSPAAMKAFREWSGRLLDPSRPGAFNQAMMELGARVCRPRAPDCGSCPVDGHCGAHRSGRAADFPVRAGRRHVPEYRVAVGVVLRRGRMLITRRPEEGLLGGLWEFPGGKIGEGETAEEACRREIAEETGLDVVVGERIATVRHAYSHFRIVMDVFRCRCLGETEDGARDRTRGREEISEPEVRLNGPTDHRWITLDEIDRYPFPAANHKFIPRLRKAGA